MGLKDAIKKMLSGTPTDSNQSTTGTVKSSWLEMKKKAHGSKTQAGKEALLALEDTE